MKIVFYDGECGLCQRSVQFLWNADVQHVLKFAPLNGRSYRAIYGDQKASMDTVLFYDGKKSFEKSTAFIEIARALGGKYSLFCLLKLIPRVIRDFFYQIIARRRKTFSCILIQKNEYFLD